MLEGRKFYMKKQGKRLRVCVLGESGEGEQVAIVRLS